MLGWAKRRRDDLATAIGLLTRFPVHRLVPVPPRYEPARAVWAFPIAGLSVGAAGAALLWAARLSGMAPSLAACWVLAAQIAASGALHEDGLADTADGLWGGRNRERRLAIMRDSRIGSFGALALIAAFALRASAVAELAAGPGGVRALLLVGLLSRGVLPLPLLLLPPARPDGLGASVSRMPRAAVFAAAMLCGGVGLLLTTPQRVAMAAAAAMLAAGLVAAAARRGIGGHTGDILGATVVAAECVMLSVLTLV
ncbi:adenosylcobinamide-GDP ribazoletransferase [Rhizosaccharibacter radicis]|uniref:Adenosylcobinamide-GDP ribazoletransferase n=1 Tax=Rhizosaccharibacter radicis TaxID=2782605 RepID=A0ABT1VYK6_9PROT|nr:adenosylcobinamide-GDP ribazoletransferase [Acetobacteraceae bacterium KSS12]